MPKIKMSTHPDPLKGFLPVVGIVNSGVRSSLVVSRGVVGDGGRRGHRSQEQGRESHETEHDGRNVLEALSREH